MNVRPSRASALAALFASPLVAGIPRLARAQAPPVLKVASDPFDAYSEVYYAQDMGFFKKAGLNVEVLTFASGAGISLAVIGGEAPIGISNPIALANAVSHGVPVTLIAGGGMFSTRSPNMLMCVPQQSAVQSPRDLDGKTVGVSALKDITQVAAATWLSQHGATISTVRFTEIPFSDMGPALERGTVDAALIVEPALEAALGSGRIRSIGSPFDAIAPEFLIGAWFSTTDFVQKNPALVKAFVAVIYQTARWANRNRVASAAILGKYSKMPPETTSRMRRVLYAESLEPRLLQPLLDVSYKSGILDKLIPASRMIATY